MKSYGDLHCDTLWRCYRHGSDLDDPTLHFKRNQPFDHLQTFAIYIPDETNDPWGYFKAVYTYGQEILRRYPKMVRRKKGAEIDAAFEKGNIPYLLSVEGGGFFGNDSARNERRVQDLKRMGISFLSLCYNAGNHLAGGTKVDFGLSEQGKEVALQLRAEGISVDLSHLNRRSTDEMLALLPDHVVATHSNCNALKEHPRNLTDAQIKKLIVRKGLIGVNFCHHFLSSPKDATIADILDHIRHILRLGGEEAVAIGGDFDGISRTPSDLPDLAAMPALGAALKAEFGEELAHCILYKNIRNYLDK